MAAIKETHIRLYGNTGKHLDDLVEEKRKRKNTISQRGASYSSVIGECINLRHQELFKKGSLKS